MLLALEGRNTCRKTGWVKRGVMGDVSGFSPNGRELAPIGAEVVELVATSTPRGRGVSIWNQVMAYNCRDGRNFMAPR